MRIAMLIASSLFIGMFLCLPVIGQVSTLAGSLFILAVCIASLFHRHYKEYMRYDCELNLISQESQGLYFKKLKIWVQAKSVLYMIPIVLMAPIFFANPALPFIGVAMLVIIGLTSLLLERYWKKNYATALEGGQLNSHAFFKEDSSSDSSLSGGPVSEKALPSPSSDLSIAGKTDSDSSLSSLR